MLFTLGRLCFVIGLRNGFGLDISTSNGFTVDLDPNNIAGSITDDSAYTDTTGYTLLLPFSFVALQWER